MEKYIFVFLLLTVLAFCVCTFPVFDMEPSATYVVCRDELMADALLQNSVKWQNGSYFVYRVENEDIKNIHLVAGGRVIREYLPLETNSFNTDNLIMQRVAWGERCVLGIPYVID